MKGVDWERFGGGLWTASLAIGVFMALATVVVFIFYAKSVPEFLPFWYGLPWGVGQLERREFVIVLPIVSLLTSTMARIVRYKLILGEFESFLMNLFVLISNLILLISLIRLGILIFY